MQGANAIPNKYYMKSSLLLSVVFLLSFSLNAQLREIPKIVEETFSNQYRGASEIEYKDQLTEVVVYFTLDGERMLATYTNKGRWKGSEKEWDFDKLTDEVKDGFDKSKFGGEEWEVVETSVIYLPGGMEQYRVKVKKNDLQKKYLYFNSKGRLLRESITI